MSFLLDLPALAALGLAVRLMAHRIFRHNPFGDLPARALTWGVGVLVVLSFLVASVGLYLDLWRFGPYGGSEWQLNSGLALGWRRSPAVDLGATFLFLTYPLFYLLGVVVAEWGGRLSSPAIREPIDLGRGRSIVAIADTHLGLAPNVVFRASGRGAEATPVLVQQFLGWLAREPLGHVPVWTGPPTGVAERRLRSPEYLVMCGDILELWDAPDESAQLAMSTLFPALQRLGAESVFVVGNHDSVLMRDRVEEGAGPGGLRIVPDVWPGPDPGDPLDPMGRGIRPIRAGEGKDARQYVFLHGHQFDRGFQAAGPLSLVPGHLRRAARLGHYAWLFLLLAAAAFGMLGTGAVPGAEPILALLGVSFLLFVIPQIYMTGGRLLFQKFGGGRYDAGRAAEGFERWWRSSAGRGRPRRGIARGHDDLAIVYGHTHMADILDRRRESRAEYPNGLPLLLNLPSWIKDPRHEQERSLFLYVDEDGYLFLGWDWGGRRPFHVPDGLLRARRQAVRKPFDAELRENGMTEEDLRRLDWPVGFREKWARVSLGGVERAR